MHQPHLLAAAGTPIGNIEIFGPLSTNAHAGPMAAFQQFESLISNTIGLLSIIAGLWFILQIIQSGIQWLGAGGDKAQLQTAQKRIINAFMGLLIVVIAYGLVAIVGKFLGLDILNPANLLNSNIRP